MRFLAGGELTQAIELLLAEDNLQIAVAFWGTGAAKKLKGKKPRILCNLTSGGTNPTEIQLIRDNKVSIRQCNDLHAKVFIGQSSTIVCSANVSTNGLGWEDGEVTGWREAGVIIPTDQSILQWFSELWDKHSSSIEDADIRLARSAWRPRRALVTGPFLNFSFDIESMPLFSWYSGDSGYTNYRAVSAATGIRRRKEIDELIANSIEIYGETERNALFRDRWVLWYAVRESSGAPLKSSFEWTCIDGVLREAWKPSRNSPYLDVATARPAHSAGPFKLTKEQIILFVELLKEPRFGSLAYQEYDDEWFTGERLNSIHEFWKELQRRAKAL